MNARLARTASDIEAELWNDFDALTDLWFSCRGDFLEIVELLQIARAAKTHEARRDACNTLGRMFYNATDSLVEFQAQRLAEVD